MSHKKTKKIKLINFFAYLAMCCALFVACSFAFVSADDKDLSKEEQEEAEETEEEIDDIADELEEIQEEKEQEVQKKVIISSELYKINSSIAGVQGKIDETEDKLERIKLELEKSGLEIDKKKKMIGSLLRSVNQADLEVQLILLDTGNNYSDYFAAVDSLSQLEEKLFGSMQEVQAEKEEFEKKKSEQEDIFEEQDAQKKELETKKSHQSWLLAQTQAEISEKEATISELQSKISKLKYELSALLGEGYDAEDIKDAIKYANKKTGVSKGFLFGMLSMESGLGKYTGGCDYKESRMNDYRKDLFKDICKELDYNYKKMKVSCPPASYSGTGGAMGVAQFMSDTWMGYKDTIAGETGHNPPDPWDLTDGVMAMALKLENDGATSDDDIRITSPCTGKKIYVDGETYAAMRYLGWSCYALTNYAPAIKSLAKGYKNL